MNPQYTPEQEADIKERIEAFRGDYLALVEQHQIDFTSYPQYHQNDRGAFETITTMRLIDKKFAPVPSNIVA